ncbi:MAG TPA: hypothetical protein PKA64_24910 [Myxococcota bacterium]|nr:hypothetical protein [Myxococcota bacterium]
MRTLLAGLSLALAACTGGDTDKGGTDDTDDTTPDAPTENELDLKTPPTGTFSCFTPVTAYDDAVWLEQSIDPAKAGVSRTIDGVVNDFEREEPRSHVEVRLWVDDVIDGPPDTFQQADPAGKVAFSAPVCQPLSYLSYPDAALDEARSTYKAHQVYGFTDGSVIAEYISVSNDTYNVVPAILGITPDPAKSIIAGTAFDCTRSPDTLSEIDAGKVEHAQVIVRNLDGTKPEGVQVRYFVENFPDRDQPDTSPDGLWTAVNVPAGDIRVEMWGLIDGEAKLLGSTQLHSVAGSINIANIFAGYDGVKYPDSCLAP